MSSRINYLFIFIVIYLNIDSIKTACIPGENCPINQGFCSQSQCICLYGYKTHFKDENQSNQIYCNYRQINRLVPLIIEFFFPSFGLFYVGRIIHGFIKLFCIITLFLYKRKVLAANIFTFLIALIFISLYFIDLICLLFAVYYDGNGMPLL